MSKVYGYGCFGSQDAAKAYIKSHPNEFPEDVFVCEVVRKAHGNFFAFFSRNREWVELNRKWEWQWKELLHNSEGYFMPGTVNGFGTHPFVQESGVLFKVHM